MIDTNKLKQLPSKTEIPCMGCHRSYNSCPIGVPIKYVPNYIKYIRKLKDGTNMTYNEPYFNKHNNLPEDYQIIKNDYFITDSMVCSFNCAMTLYFDNPQLYHNTPTLISMMYKRIFNKFPEKPILKSPHWRLRKQYDGPLSDDEFEHSLQTIKFIDTNQIDMRSCGRIYEVYDI